MVLNLALENEIVTLMERIFELSTKATNDQPSTKDLKEIKGDLVFKEKEMKNSQNTYEGLMIG